MTTDGNRSQPSIRPQQNVFIKPAGAASGKKNLPSEHSASGDSMQPQGIALALNIGSGQRRFHSTSDVEWVNIDCVSRPPEQVPDLVCDVGTESLPIPNDHADYCVLHHVYEHFGLGEGHPVIRECHRVLKPGGILILTVPDMR